MSDDEDSDIESGEQNNVDDNDIENKEKNKRIKELTILIAATDDDDDKKRKNKSKLKYRHIIKPKSWQLIVALIIVMFIIFLVGLLAYALLRKLKMI